MMNPEQRTPQYNAILALLDEQKKWKGEAISKASRKRAEAAFAILGVTDQAEINDFIYG